MTAAERVQAAARVLARHLSVPCHDGRCVCGQPWNLKHQAQELDEAGLLDDLRDELAETRARLAENVGLLRQVTIGGQ